MGNVKVCSKCNAVTNEDFVYCNKCGGSLKDTGYSVAQWNSFTNEERANIVRKVTSSDSGLKLNFDRAGIDRKMDEAAKAFSTGMKSVSSFAKNPGGSGLYKNVGEKIRRLASVLAIIGIVFSCLTGIGYFGMGLAIGQSDGAFFSFFTGLLIAALGSFFAWIGSLAFYGFGELIIRVNEIAETIRK